MARALLLQNVCHTLWCSVGTTCHSKLDAAVDGTACGESKVGVRGQAPRCICAPIPLPPKPLSAEWRCGGRAGSFSQVSTQRSARGLHFIFCSTPPQGLGLA